MAVAAPRPVPLDVRVVTVYHATEAQTDAEPLVTADGSRITLENIAGLRYCAVSQELLAFKGGPVHFGDTIHVEGIGELSGSWFVHDTLHASITGYVDLLVSEDINECWVAEGAQVKYPGGCKTGVRVSHERR